MAGSQHASSLLRGDGKRNSDFTAGGTIAGGDAVAVLPAALEQIPGEHKQPEQRELHGGKDVQGAEQLRPGSVILLLDLIQKHHHHALPLPQRTGHRRTHPAAG